MSDAAMQPRSLSVERLTVRYGGVVAVDDVSLQAAPATITGLIGPNGAGKTTLFNACAGTATVASGSVRLGDRALDSMSPARRAQAGLGRTFQRIELFESMTVLENVRMGCEARLAGRSPVRQVAGTRAERRHLNESSEAAIEQCGVERLATRNVGELPTGQRRLVELARAVAADFTFLLLDEPSSGLDVRETERFAAVLSDVVERGGVGILLVEHDMRLIRETCPFTYVLDFGKLIHEGATSEVLASDIVQLAYLGAEEVA